MGSGVLSCPQSFHREATDYRVAALPLSPAWDGVTPHCPSCGRAQGGVTVQAALVDRHLRPVPLVIQ